MLAFGVAIVVYAVALLGFRIFDPVRLARQAAMEQMHEGFLVLDTRQVVLDLNPAAEKILSCRAAAARGRPAAAVPALAIVLGRLEGAEHWDSDVTLGSGPAARQYAVRVFTTA